MGVDSYGFFICGNLLIFIYFMIIEISFFCILILLNFFFIYCLKKLLKCNVLFYLGVLWFDFFVN